MPRTTKINKSKNSLVNNINKRKKSGKSRSKSNSTISDENYNKLNGEVFNVGLSNANLNKRELAETIKSYLPNLVIIENEFGIDKDNRNYIVSNDKLEATGWKPRYTIEDGINELMSAYKMIITDNNKKYTNL